MVLLDGAKGRCALELWRVAELVEILRVREENQMCVLQVLRALSNHFLDTHASSAFPQ